MFRVPFKDTGLPEALRDSYECISFSDAAPEALAVERILRKADPGIADEVIAGHFIAYAQRPLALSFTEIVDNFGARAAKVATGVNAVLFHHDGRIDASADTDVRAVLLARSIPDLEGTVDTYRDKDLSEIVTLPGGNAGETVEAPVGAALRSIRRHFARSVLPAVSQASPSALEKRFLSGLAKIDGQLKVQAQWRH